MFGFFHFRQDICLFFCLNKMNFFYVNSEWHQEFISYYFTFFWIFVFLLLIQQQIACIMKEMTLTEKDYCESLETITVRTLKKTCSLCSSIHKTSIILLENMCWRQCSLTINVLLRLDCMHMHMLQTFWIKKR